MAPKRKVREPAESCRELHQSKKAKIGCTASTVKPAVLQQYYDNVQTLREYLLCKLPSSSRLRRKKIASLGFPEAPLATETVQVQADLFKLLDTALVCVHHQSDTQLSPDLRWEQWRSFSQKADESVISLSGGLAGATYSQSEIVDFVIWQLYSRARPGGQFPRHLLCDGFRKRAQIVGNAKATTVAGSIPGLTSVHQNHFAQALKDAPWPQLLMLLGKSGEQIMIDLLIDAAIFLPVRAGVGNMYQLSGTPMLETDRSAKTKSQIPLAQQQPEPKALDLGYERLASHVTFVRNRVMYARAALTGRGTVYYGLRHIHVLNRCAYVSYSEEMAAEEKSRLDQANEQSTLKVMMYIFPRQFGLHNVFTSKVDVAKTSQKLADYTLREEEISSESKKRRIRTPKRLRGEAKTLVQRLQLLHGRCAYAELLRHHCPSFIDSYAPKPSRSKALKHSRGREASKASLDATHRPLPTRRAQGSIKNRPQSQQSAPSKSPVPMIKYDRLTDLATPVSRVSAFCRAVLSRLIPNDFWGSGDKQIYNRNMVFKKVDHFVRLRRFESLNLQEVTDGLKVTCIDWMTPPALRGQKTSQTDMKKRLEILNEFLYYVFDSILIPLLRSNFYITESSSHRYRLFFFRHDVWRHVAEPATAELRAKMFEEVESNEANRILKSRRLGFSRIRLLPKEDSMRPIANLKRRMPKQGSDKTLLGPSINSVLGPVHSVLRLEAERNPSRLGSSMFSVGEVYPRLKNFAAGLGEQERKLYFAKVDVQSAFDTIPQQAIIKLMETIPSQELYVIQKHLEVRAGSSEARLQGNQVSKLRPWWHSLAVTRDDSTGFLRRVEERLGQKKKNTIFVGNTMRREHDTRELTALMTSHIRQNLVKFGKKFYRQKNGIPQGSVLSSALCNYFYADLEFQRLSFLAAEDCLLLRLIDDFLLITTSQAKGRKFVEVMHGGFPDYGVTVNPYKTLVNFDMELGGMTVPKALQDSAFPYCGLGIDCNTLEIVKTCNARSTVISDTLTVDYGRNSGQNFQRKVLSTFKIQSHIMFYDTKHNTFETVVSNLHKAMTETAEKMWAYWRCLPARKRPGNHLITNTITRVVDVAFALLTGKARKEKYPGYSCALERAHVSWLVLDAMKRVMARKQANFTAVLSWIDTELGRLDGTKTARVRKHVR